ncbi:MAG: GNAT family N-acetyltransferase [Anaerolineae bacterium]|nr:GNAT family N-acetyltransferase [Anaerolineales bacterium]MCQ3978753.1 GNAT family N-acetyltransferase [Anaerolineae bacterium]
MPFTIRDLQSYDEMRLVHQLQRQIWGLAEPDVGLYPPLLVSAAKNGGVVLGAFDDATGQMIGFLFGFLGREPSGPLKLCSQTMGVLKEWRGQGVAEALKRVQRERVIAQGLSLITWTYDPLEGPNAHLNLHKLGAISRTYWRDVYGSHFGALNAGLPTDRLVVEWWVNQPRREVAAFDLALPIFEVAGTGVERRIVRANLNFDTTPLQLEIPADIHPLKTADMNLALDWRLNVRVAFEAYFGQGYQATDFISSSSQGERRNYYLLEKP